MVSIYDAAVEVLHSHHSSLACHSPGSDRQVCLRVKECFIAFGGVLCIAFEGFPLAIDSFKSKFVSVLEASGSPPPTVAKENPGSMWAKITIAARSEKSQLSVAQWEAVRLALAGASERCRQSQCSCVFDTISVVTFECRSLERIMVKETLPIQVIYSFLDSDPGSDDCASSLLSTFSRGRIAAILEDVHDEARWPQYLKDCVIGKQQSIADYRENSCGSTIVSFLPRGGGCNESFELFIDAVESALQEAGCWELFTWLPRECLHMTIRGL